MGNYYLSQIDAGQTVDSPCVDAGSDTAVNLGMDNSTTRTDVTADDGIVDMGFHYRLTHPADLNVDGIVNLIDFTILGYQWQQQPGTPSADIMPTGGDNFVDLFDLSLMCENWLWTAP